MLIFFSLLIAGAQQPENPACRLDEEDKRTNAALSFDEFDQEGALPSTGRSLGEAGCWREAAEAWEDYLVNGPAVPASRQRILRFHLGQALAFAGEEARAAPIIAGTRRPADEIAPPDLDWNQYVVGTWAFLVKDRETLIAARDSVLASAGEGNAINGNILAGLERCFDQPYSIAYDPDCGR